MGSAERCQAAGIPDASREVKLPKRASARGGETTKVEDFAWAVCMDSRWQRPIRFDQRLGPGGESDLLKKCPTNWTTRRVSNRKFNAQSYALNGRGRGLNRSVQFQQASGFHVPPLLQQRREKGIFQQIPLRPAAPDSCVVDHRGDEMPARLSPLLIRYGAIRLRKLAHEIRSRAGCIPDDCLQRLSVSGHRVGECGVEVRET
jgi:hypothetical protein